MKRALLLLALVGCKPDFAKRESLVDAQQVLAVRAEPAEAKPGESVTFTALVVSPTGEVSDPVAWTYCSTPKLLTENTAVSAACNFGGTAVAPTSTLPADGCAVFGPEVTSAELRPRDPDATGGFYQPIRVNASSSSAFGFARLRCNLANVGAAVVLDFTAKYVPNANPTLLFAPPTDVTAGATIPLQASWPPDSAESYAYVDRATQTVITKRETIRVSWHATAGSFDNDRTGRESTDPAVTSDNVWTAPDAPGPVTMWLVLRDDRGGVTWERRVITVR